MKNIMTAVNLLTLALASLSFGQTTYPYFINTAAGSYVLGDGGPAVAALLESPRAVAMDAKGNLYIGDNSNSLIRKVTAGTITTVPGGTGVTTWAIALDAAGNLYFTDATYEVSRLTPSGTLTVVAGSTTQGFTGDEARATSALLRNPYGVAVDNVGDIYIADSGNNRIRKITPDGIIHTVAGTGTAAYNGDGPASSANLNPRGLALDAAGNLYIADYSNHRIRKMAPDGSIGTIAGTGTNSTTGDGGPATKAALSFPTGLALDSAGNLYVGTSGRVRRISPDGTIQAFAGTGIIGYTGDGGPATAAEIDPLNLAADSAGNLYVADNSNCRVRIIKPDGTINTAAGASHFAGDGGPATSAVLHFPYDVALDGAGNMYIADNSNNRVRKVNSSGVISTYAGTGNTAFNSASGPATQVNISNVRGLAADASGNLYIADTGNCRIRRVTPDGNLTTVAGNGSCLDGADGGPAVSSSMTPYALAADAAGNLYISDYVHSRVRKVSSDGTIRAFAGTGTSGSGADGVPATQSAFNTPQCLAVDKAGNVYIADPADQRVRMVNPAGVIGTVAGNGSNTAFPLNDGKPAAAVGVYYPTGIAVDGQGNLYITQPNISYIRKVSASGIITTIAGNNSWAFAGDGGPGMSASVNFPRGIAVDAAGNLYFADSSNHRVRSLVLNSPVELDIASGNNQSAPFGQILPQALAVKLAGRAGGVPGIQVSFAVTAGSATLSAATAYTDSNGVASTTAVVGSTAGKLSVTATAAGVPPAVFALTVLDPNAVVPGGPSITTGGVVGAGLSSPAVTNVSANGIVTIYGSNFAPAGTARTVTSADLVNGRLPTKLAGICVQVGTAMAPILAVFPSQLNIQIPYSPLSANVYVQVILNCGASGEVRSNMQSVTVRYATPEFLYFALHPNGANPIAATDAVTGDLIGAPGLIPNTTLRPAKPGDVLTLYGTGFGATSPPTDAGVFPTKIASTVLPPTVTIGGIALAATDILYAGVSPNNPGLYQLNIRIPAAVPDGDQPVVLGLGMYTSPSGGFLTVKR